MKNLKKTLISFAVSFACFVPVLAYGQVQTFPYQNPNVQFFDNLGVVCSGCTLSTFAAGTVTPLATYSDAAGTVPNSNPITLDSAGRATIYLTSASYKFVLKSALGVTLVTQDNITAANLASTLTSLTVNGTVQVIPSTAATSGANQSSPLFEICGNYFNASSLPDCFTLQNVLGTGSSPTPTFNVTHSGSSGAPGINLNGASLSAGAGTLASLNNLFFVVTSGDVGAAINAVDTSIGSGVPGVIEVPPFTTATATTPIVLTKSHTLRIRGTGTLTVTGTSNSVPAIQIPDSSTDISGLSEIECPEHATIKLAAGSNSAIIQDQNFLTLSGSGNTFGTFRVSIKGCQLDGNKANQTALVTSGTGTPSTVARTSGGVSTIVLTGTPSPAIAVGQTCNVSGLTNDSSKFNGRFIAQSGTSGNTLVYFQDPAAHGTVASTAATTAAPYSAMSVVCYSGSNGIRLFGRSYWLEDVTVANNVLDDIWVEGYTPTSFTDDTTQLESTIKRIRTINSGGDGIVFWGPQNTKIWDTTSFKHGQWGREILQPMFDTDSVSYLNTAGSEHVFNVAVIEKGSQESSAAGWGILVEPGGGANIYEGVYTFCNGCIGLEFRSPGHKYSGIIGASSPADTIGVKFNSGSASIDAFMANNTTYFDCTSLSGETMVKVWNNDAVGSVGAANCASGGDALGLIRTAVVQSPTSANRINHNPYTALYNAGNGFTPSFPAITGVLASTAGAQSFTGAQTFSTSINMSAGVLISNTAPTISSGFGTTPSIANTNGTASFTINVGTGGTASTGTIGLPAAPHGWNCTCTDVTTSSSTVFACKQTGAGTTTTAPIGEFTAAGAAQAWTASDIVAVSCHAY